MSLWDLFSFVAVAVAAVPPLYFAVVLRTSKPAFGGLSALLAAALLLHGLYHLAEALVLPHDTVLGFQAASAVLILAFALTYWPLRRRRDP
ncbi:MAG TPA: hypothetical protein VJ400_07810 [Thermoplasmata archaeon]|nr:hypothetical protein [Thermoplasmata archaeon]